MITLYNSQLPSQQDYQQYYERVAEKLTTAIRECQGITAHDKSLATSDINRMVTDLQYRLETEYCSEDRILSKEMNAAWTLYDAFLWKKSAMMSGFWEYRIFKPLRLASIN